jgi:hypothetical protein
MGDAAGQQTDALQLLRLIQAVLGVLAIRDVADEADDVRRPLRRSIQRLRREDRPLRVGGVADDLLSDALPARLQYEIVLPPRLVGVFFGKYVGVRSADELPAALSRELALGFVDPNQPVVAILHEDRRADAVDDALQEDARRVRAARAARGPPAQGHGDQSQREAHRDADQGDYRSGHRPRWLLAVMQTMGISRVGVRSASFSIAPQSACVKVSEGGPRRPMRPSASRDTCFSR